jgi:hypothetical protein
MPLQAAPLGAHPQGEPNLSIFSPSPASVGLEPVRVPLDLHGKRIYVEWDPHAPVTALGQLVYFSRFLATAVLFRDWAADCPLQYTGPHAPTKTDVLGRGGAIDPGG